MARQAHSPNLLLPKKTRSRLQGATSGTRKEFTMALDFYDSTGRPYAYSDDGETLYTFGGLPVAYLDGDSVYGFSGAHLGYFKDGVVRDRNGDALLFTDGARGGPMKPMKQIKPIRGIKQIKPMRGIKQIKPVKPVGTLAWSSVTPEDVFEV